MTLDSHITDEGLLMMAGGRLSTAHQSMVTDHIRRCSTCSARFNKMKVACAVFERISEDGLDGVRRVNRSSAPGRFEIDPAFPWRLICGIIAGCVLVMFALFNRQVIPSANASELLDDAVRNEGQSKSAYLYEMSVDGMVCLAKQNNDTLVSLNRAPSCGGIVRRIQATPWGHGNPLSARTFRTWRYSLGKLQQTRVTGVDPVEIETTARQGRVSVASIYLRHIDYHPTKVVLRFDDQQIVTVSEAAAPEPTVVGSFANALQPPQMHHSDEPEDLIETSAWETLQHLDADSGWTARVARHGTAVVVEVVVESATAKQDFIRAFRANPEIRLDLYTTDEVQRPLGFLPNRAIVPGGAPPVANDWLMNKFPSDPDRARFVNTALQLSQDILGRAYWRDELNSRRNALAACSCSHRFSALISEEQRRLLMAQLELSSLLEPLTGPPLKPTNLPISYRKAKLLDLAVQRLLIGRPRSETSMLQAETILLRHLLQGA